MTDEKNTRIQNDLLNELIKERPSITYLTELGITLQDYITAELMMSKSENDPSNSPLYSNYAMCLFFTVAERIKLMAEYMH